MFFAEISTSTEAFKHKLLRNRQHQPTQVRDFNKKPATITSLETSVTMLNHLIQIINQTILIKIKPISMRTKKISRTK
jgi:hypothetical protein